MTIKAKSLIHTIQPAENFQRSKSLQITLKSFVSSKPQQSHEEKIASTAYNALDDLLCDVIDEFIEDDYVAAQSSYPSMGARSFKGDMLSSLPEKNNQQQSTSWRRVHSLHALLAKFDVEPKNFAAVTPMLLQVLDRDEEFDVIACHALLPGKLLEVVASTIFSCYNNFESVVRLDGHKWHNFLEYVTNHYQNQPYHNIEHATDVLFNTHCLFAPGAFHTCFTENQQYATLLASIVHDIGHIGHTNAYLKATQHVIAQEYSYSPARLESMHLHMAYMALQDNSFGLLHGMQAKDILELHDLFSKLIYATDLAMQQNVIQQGGPHVQHDILRLLIHVADLGSFFKPLRLHQQWASRVRTEMDREHVLSQTAQCDIVRPWQHFATTQVQFIQNIVLPVHEALDEHSTSSKTPQHIRVLANYRYWALLAPSTNVTL